MYLLEIFINNDHLLPSKSIKDNKKIGVLLTEKNSHPLNSRISLIVLKESVLFFKTKEDAKKWAIEFRKDYAKDIDKDEDGEEVFSFLITNLDASLKVNPKPSKGKMNKKVAVVKKRK